MIIERWKVFKPKWFFYGNAVKTSFWKLYFMSVLILNICCCFLNWQSTWGLPCFHKDHSRGRNQRPLGRMGSQRSESRPSQFRRYSSQRLLEICWRLHFCNASNIFHFVSRLDLMTYDTVKHFLLRNTSMPDNSICHGLARWNSVILLMLTHNNVMTHVQHFYSICSGLVAAIMGTPADVVKTRVMNQPRDSNGRLVLYINQSWLVVEH